MTAALALAALPASALASGSYTWSLASNFTSAAPGANPDKGPYGDHPWSYLGGSGTFSASFNGGLAGWKDASGDVVAINPGATAISNGGATYAPGQIVAQPTFGKTATIAWTSPLSSAATVTVSGSLVADNPGAITLLCPAANWSLDNNGTQLAYGSAGTSPATFSQSVTVAPGKALHLALSLPAVSLGSAACAATGVNLTVSAPAPDPVVSLDDLGTKPLTTATPTFTGSASKDFGDGSQVGIALYQGAKATGTWFKVYTAAIGADGHYSLTAPAGLPDGQYTAEAGETGPSGTASVSRPMTFRIKVNPPAVTLSTPTVGANVPLSLLQFTGSASTALGDSSDIVVTIYDGSSTSGRRVATAFGTSIGGAWSAPAPASLAPGLYTAQATQYDDAGHVALSDAHTFFALPAAKTNAAGTIGGPVTLGRGGSVTVPIGCRAPSGERCTGTVLVLTTRSYHAAGGGPVGPLRLMFAYVSIPAGRTVTVRRTAPTAVRAFLRHAHGVTVRVTARLGAGGGAPRTFTAVKALRITG